MILLVMAVVVMSSGVDAKDEARKTSSQVDRKLELLNKPAVKSIKVYFSSILTSHYPLNYIIHAINAPYINYS
jgi:hypothetical protein